jgi:hypothetical protein
MVELAIVLLQEEERLGVSLAHHRQRVRVWQVLQALMVLGLVQLDKVGAAEQVE